MNIPTPITDATMKFCFNDDKEFVRVEDMRKLEIELIRIREIISRLVYEFQNFPDVLGIREENQKAIKEFCEEVLLDDPSLLIHKSL